MEVGTLRISEPLILRGSTGECRQPGCGGRVRSRRGGPPGSGGSLRPPARSHRGSGSCNSLAGMNCQTWPRAGRDEPVIIFKFAIIDLRKSCGDKDELICKFIGEINPAVIKKPPLRCRGGRGGGGSRPRYRGGCEDPPTFPRKPSRPWKPALLPSFSYTPAPASQPRGGRGDPVAARAPPPSPGCPRGSHSRGHPPHSPRTWVEEEPS